MMKKIINKIGVNLMLLLMVSLLITACKKSDEEKLDPPRLFKASDIKITTAQTSAKITWTVPLFAVGKPLTYTVDFSTDPAFSTIAFSKIVDTAGVTVTDDNITVRIPYYARIKANSFENQPESKTIVSSSFTLTGVQLFLTLREDELRENTVSLRFLNETGLSSIKLTPASGSETTIALTATDLTAGDNNNGLKLITGLTGGLAYTAELFAGTKSKGILNFTTLPVTVYTTTISPSDDLTATILNAANGATIGLNPGTYNVSSAATFITGKTITLKSTSGTPKDTKINYKEFDIEGTGAGITFSGLELDGTAGASLYFINFIGSQANNAVAATFTNVFVNNCIVHGSTTAFLRADRGTAASTFKITDINVTNSVIYDMGNNGTSAYYTFHLNKLEFKNLIISKSTFYNAGPGLITASTLVSATVPTINISYSTFNGFGGNAKYALLDANTNPIIFSLQNSILSNTPKSGSVVAAAIRSNGSGSTSTFSYNNIFNFNSAGTTALTFPATVSQAGNLAINLGYDANASSFKLPVVTPLRTASNTSIAIGDPRWTY